MKQHIAGCLALALLATGALCLSLAPVASAGGGNSANAKLCQNGGWQNLVRSDRTPFANQGDCVSDAAHGGALQQRSQAQIDCQSYGGTFTGFVGGNQKFACDGWTTTSLDDFNSKQQTLTNDCVAPAVGGTSLDSVPDPPSVYPATVDSSCSNVG